MLYHSLIYSKLQYGILVWGINGLIKTALFALLSIFSRNCSRMSCSYKSLYLLKLKEVYKLELAEFMFALHNNRLRKIFYDALTKLESVHDHNTRQ